MTNFDLTMRLLLAAGLGAALGLERELRGKPAGLRTNMLIALGAALFTVVSLALGRGDDGTVDRVAAQVVTGIGFLGGGVILRSGMSVVGLTTAATIWVNAAIGMAAGAGEFAVATIGTAIAVAVLGTIAPIERYLERRSETGKRPDG
jgi:putative Mg2+ transporter-C (MgtC) family protein